MIKKKINWKIVVVGLLCLTVLEAIALLKGINGVLLTIIVGIIATAIGIQIPKEKIIKVVKGGK